MMQNSTSPRTARRIALGALAVAAVALATLATADRAAAETKWRLNSAYEFDGYASDMAKWFAARVGEKSGGELVVEPHFSSSLGFKSNEALRSVSQGLAELNISYISGGEEPLAAFAYMPYLFDTMPDWIRWGYDSYKPLLDKRLREKWKVGVLTIFTFPEVRLWSKAPLKTLDDFEGLKVRAPGSLPTGRLMDELGATMVSVPTAEVYAAMQRGVADALQTSAVTFTEQRLWEVAGFAQNPALSGDVGNALIMNLDAYEALPPASRKAVDEAAAELEAYALGRFLTHYYAELLEKVEANGVQYYEMDPSLRAHLNEVMPTLYRKWAEEVGPDAVALIKAAGKWQ